MNRRLRWLLTAALAVLLVGGAPREGFARLGWEPVTVVGARAGLTAVAVDPDDPRIVWVAGSGGVWVSDDAGDSWQLVLQLLQRSRNRGGADDDDEDRDDDDVDEAEDTDNATDEEEDVDPSVDTDSAPEDDAKADVEEADVPEVVERQVGTGIVRLRVLGSSVFVCTGRGLWQVDRAARTLGSGQEVRLGRTSAVLDVAAGPVPDSIWVATSRGLVRKDVGDIARSVQGALGAAPVRALLYRAEGTLAAGPRGLWQWSGGSWRKLGLALGRRVVVDLAGLPNGDVAVAAQREVVTVRVGSNRPPSVVATTQLPSARRLAVGRDKGLWAVGGDGPWRLGSGRWRPRWWGLPDRNIVDIAPSPSGPAWLWLVGTAGAFRQVTETDAVMAKRWKQLAAKAIEGKPTAWDTLRAVERVHHADLEGVWGVKAQQGLSLLLPEVRLTYQTIDKREEDGVRVPGIGTVPHQLQVTPGPEQFSLVATWDLAPRIWASLDLQGPYQDELRRARKARVRIRKKVLGIYEAWRGAEVAVATRKGGLKTALRRELVRQRLQADLYAYTEGWFPVTPVAGRPTQ